VNGHGDISWRDGEVLQRLQDEADDARHARGWEKATQQGMGLALKEDT
jgi:hypothetical protein